MSLTVDEIFESVGSCGCYQVTIIFLIGMVALVPAFQQLLGTFIAAEPGWRCVKNSTVCTLNGTFTADSSSKNYSYRCQIPREDWEFTSQYNYTSVITEWDLVCDRAILGTFATSLVLLGVLPGSLIFGYVADKYGRKPGLFSAVYLCTFAAGGSALVPQYWMFAVLRFITGIGCGGLMIIGPNLPLEFTGVRHRGTAGIATQAFWSLGLMLLALLAYCIREWWKLDLLCAVIGLPAGFFWICIPESIRFQILKGKTDKAMKSLRRVAKCNGKIMPTDTIDFQYGTGSNSGKIKGQNICIMFHTWKLTMQTFALWFSWLVCAMVYYGVSIGSSSLGGNMYLDFFLSSATELPAAILCIIMISRVGRKKLIVTGLFLAAISAGVCALVFPPEETSTAMTAGRITMALIAKFCISPAFGFLYIFTAELLPTSIRIIGVGSCSAAARIGSFSAPYVLFLGQYWNVLPYGIMAVFSLIAGVLCLTLPETHMQPTKEILEDEPETPKVDEPEIVVNDENPLIT